MGHDGEFSPIDVLVKSFDAARASLSIASCEYLCSTSFRVREAKAMHIPLYNGQKWYGRYRGIPLHVYRF